MAHELLALDERAFPKGLRMLAFRNDSKQQLQFRPYGLQWRGQMRVQWML